MPDIIMMPSAQTQPDDALAPVPKSTFGQAADAEFHDTLDSGITGSLLSSGENDLLKSYDPGPKLTANEIPNSLRHQFPNGGDENVVAHAMTKQEGLLQNQYRLANMSTNTISHIGVDGVGLATSFLDPGNIAAGAALGGVGEIGVKGATSLLSLSRGAQIGARAVAGIGEGAGFTAMQNVARYNYEKQAGGDPQSLDITDGMFLNSIIGGGLHSLAGRTPGLDTQAQDSAEQVTKAQMMNGNISNPYPIIQQGIFDSMSKYKEQQYTPAVWTKNESYPFKQDLGIPQLHNVDIQRPTTDNLSAYSNILNDKIGTINSHLNNLPVEKDPTNTVDYLNKTWDVLRKDPMSWSKDDFNQWKEASSMPHMKEMIDAGADNQLELTDRQNNIIHNLDQDPKFENKLPKNYIDEHTNKINTINEALQKKGFDDPYGKDLDYRVRARMPARERNAKYGRLSSQDNENINSVVMTRNKLEQQLGAMKDRLDNLKQAQIGDETIPIRQQLKSLKDKVTNAAGRKRQQLEDRLANKQIILRQLQRKAERTRQARSSLLLRKNTLQNLKDHVDGQLKYMSVGPTAASDLHSEFKANFDGLNQSYVSAADGDLNAQMVADLEGKHDLNYVKDMVKKMSDNGEIPDVLMDAGIEDEQNIKDTHARFTKGLSDMISCIFRSK